MGKSSERRADLLIEIGCEELPPKSLDELREALFEAVCAGLEREQIAFDRASSRAYSTPRRLALALAGVADRQPDQFQERRGPSLAAAFDTDGQPTAAAAGFARSVGLEVKQLETVRSAKGAWLVARVGIDGRSLGELLFPLLEQAVKQLPVPRPMRWADHDFSFVRPVHWLVVLYGQKVLNGRLLGHPAGKTTRGHRVHAPGPHRIGAAQDYLEVLRAARVLADAAERRSRIRDLLRAADPLVRIDEALLAEVSNLVEWPVAVAGSFDAAFLEVPHQALIASMQDHLRFFPVQRDAKGVAISNRFVAIANLESAQVERVREGFERVVRPRLADAQFFLEQDSKRGLEAFGADLEQVVFQQKIGTIGDKSRRIAAISRKLAAKLGVDPVSCERAAVLAKCDLMTLMVGEFPELQGTMGGHYARRGGEEPAVAIAIEEHYRPRYAGDAIPGSPAGRVLGLADRADSLVGIFAAGQRPSGNKDPFALRRAALGLVRILLEARLDVGLERLLAMAANELAAQGVAVDPATLAEVREFVAERTRSHFREAGLPAELINAAMASQWRSLPDLASRLDALNRFIGDDTGVSLAAANKRIGNILRKSETEFTDKIDENRLTLAEERALFHRLREAESAVDPLLERADYAASLSHLASLRPVVDAFFDHVLVMDADLEVRRNRLALLARLKAQFDRVGDLSVLG